jgi:hypothetical protein
MLIKFTNVKWDLDDDLTLADCNLEENFLLCIDNSDVSDIDMSDDEITDYISDYITEYFGYCHFGFDYEVIEITDINYEQIKQTIDDCLKQMLASEDNLKYVLPLFDIENKHISVKLCWVGGYEFCETKYVDSNGYGINIVIVEVNDNKDKNISERTLILDDDEIISWIKEQL